MVVNDEGLLADTRTGPQPDGPRLRRQLQRRPVHHRARCGFPGSRRPARQPGSGMMTEQTTTEAPRVPEKRWYVIHTYSGYENKVKANLEHRIESMGMEDKIFQVLV